MVQHRPLKDMEGDLDDMDEDLDARFWEPHGTAHGDGTPRAVCRSGIVDHVSHVGRWLSRRRKRCRPLKRWRGAAVGGMTLEESQVPRDGCIKSRQDQLV